jgi:hypothetical protein
MKRHACIDGVDVFAFGHGALIGPDTHLFDDGEGRCDTTINEGYTFA